MIVIADTTPLNHLILIDQASVLEALYGRVIVPYAVTQRDTTFDDEERWITVGAIGPGSMLLVVHTFYEKDNEEIIRIISARAAESHEKGAYAEAHQGAEARHRRHRHHARRRH
jgi:uncharacterized DUF497 family protein